MRRAAFVLGSLLLSLSVGCRRKSPPPPPTPDPCVTNCQLRSKQLSCKHPERCAEQCDKVKAAVHCKAPLDGFMKCALTQEKDWECGPNDVAVLGGHETCETERESMLTCLSRSQGKL